jgi:hypothetical protein
MSALDRSSHQPATLTNLEHAVRVRLRALWDAGTQRSRAETAGFMLAEIDVVIERWLKEGGE